MRKLTIRPATAQDREAVLAFCANTWEGGDYIDHVYVDWFVEGGLFVGEHEPGRPIALIHLLLLSSEEAWLEGLRVAPELRGQRLGRQLIEFGIRWAQERGARTLGMLSSSQNAVMQHLSAHFGFQQLLRARWHHRTPHGDPQHDPSLVNVAAGSIDLDSARLLRAQHKLYTRGWSFQQLSRELLEEHAKRRELLQPHDRSAWAIIDVEEPQKPSIAHMEGDFQALCRLLEGLWHSPLMGKHVERVSALAVVNTPIAHALTASGFESSTNDYWLYRRPLVGYATEH